MNHSSITEKLAKKWDVDYYDAERILHALDAKKWTGGEGLASITHAGTIDHGYTDMIAGHNGYWIADSDSNAICYVTNGDPVWTSFDDEDALIECDLDYDGNGKVDFEGHEI